MKAAKGFVTVVPVVALVLVGMRSAEVWAQPAETVLGVPCSEIFQRGIDRQMNIRAGLIRVGCGLETADNTGPTPEGLDSVFGSTNINVTPGGDPFYTTQSESMVWSTPDGQTIVVNYNDYRDVSLGNYSGVSVSKNGGTSFTRLLPSPFATGHGSNYGDPVVVFNIDLGRWFASYMAGGCGGHGLGVWTSTDAITWTPAPCAHNGAADDRESMWVDNNADSPYFGRMYVSWNDFSPAGEGAIFVTHSDKKGTTWSTPVRVNVGLPHFIRNVQLTGSLGRDGTVFIAGMDEHGGYSVEKRTNWIYRSSNGGDTWDAIRMGADFRGPGSATCFYFRTIAPIWRHMGMGQPAVGPNRVVHYAYAGQGVNLPSDPGDIFYTRSLDNGDTWSYPKALNTDTATLGNRAQWMPSMSVTPEGEVLVTWYDRRNSTNGTNYEYFGIQSSDNGATWGGDFAISDRLIPQPGSNGICYAGDYNYQTAINGKAWATWTDGRNPINGDYQQDVYFAGVDHPQPEQPEIPVCTHPATQWDPVSTVSMNGGSQDGAIITWHDDRDNSYYTQKLDMLGRPLWGPCGFRVDATIGHNEDPLSIQPQMVSDSRGGAVFAYVKRVGNYRHVFAALIKYHPSLPADAAPPVQLSTLSGDSGNIRIAASGADFIVTWDNHEIHPSSPNIYAQKVNRFAQKLWGGAERVVCDHAETQVNPEILSDGAGGAYIVFLDDRNPSVGFDLYGQRLDRDGNRLWDADGKLIYLQDRGTLEEAGAPRLLPSYYNHKMVMSAAGDFIIAHPERMGYFASQGILAQRVNGDGDILWAKRVSPNNYDTERNPLIVSDGAGGASVLWEGRLSALGKFDIYGSRINQNGSIIWLGKRLSELTTTAGVDKWLPTSAISNGIVVQSTNIVAPWQTDNVGAADALNVNLVRLSNGCTALLNPPFVVSTGAIPVPLMASVNLLGSARLIVYAKAGDIFARFIPPPAQPLPDCPEK